MWLCVIVHICGYSGPYTDVDPDTSEPWQFTLVDCGEEPHPNPVILSWDVKSANMPSNSELMVKVDASMIDDAYADIFANPKAKPQARISVRQAEEARQKKLADQLEIKIAEALELERRQMELAAEESSPPSQEPPILATEVEESQELKIPSSIWPVDTSLPASLLAQSQPPDRPSNMEDVPVAEALDEWDNSPMKQLPWKLEPEPITFPPISDIEPPQRKDSADESFELVEMFS